MADRFAPGTRVRTRRADPPHHTRLPRYARGAVGTVVESEGRHPLADDRARGLASEPQTVLPRRPAGTEGASETELAALVTRNGLIGVAAV